MLSYFQRIFRKIMKVFYGKDSLNFEKFLERSDGVYCILKI